LSPTASRRAGRVKQLPDENARLKKSVSALTMLMATGASLLAAITASFTLIAAILLTSFNVADAQKMETLHRLILFFSS